MVNEVCIPTQSVGTSEADFEAALIEVLSHKGWESEVIKNPSEADLLQNWADILFKNNSGIDRLNDVPLTTSEMQQIVEQIRDLKTPLKLNGFINGKTVNITRDNPKALYMTKNQLIANPLLLKGLGLLGHSSEINFLINFLD